MELPYPKILEGLPQKKLSIVLNIPILNNLLKKKIKSKSKQMIRNIK